jgi:hypothetical protein
MVCSPQSGPEAIMGDAGGLDELAQKCGFLDPQRELHIPHTRSEDSAIECHPSPPPASGYQRGRGASAGFMTTSRLQSKASRR